VSIWSALLAYAIVARVTRFITDDTLFAPARAWIIRRYGVAGWLSVLVECPWCVSIWVAGPVAAVALAWGDQWWFVFLGLWLGLSYAVALVAVNLDRARS
jgi:hypothetical protein